MKSGVLLMGNFDLQTSKPNKGQTTVWTMLPWGLAVLVLLILPFVFSANGSIVILNQMAVTVVFALSYNMLLGQAGMLSFGHAVYMGVGGFACIHVMNWVQSGNWPVPLPLLPLFAGLFSMGVAMIIGAFSTRSSGVIFAMITLGIVELVASFSIIIVTFFSYGGASGDRTLGMPIFGIEFIRHIEVYYLIAGWVILSAALMYSYSRTPLGRMANAVRDNPQRAEFVGYSARWVRYYSFCVAGFFAGVAGGLSAIAFEIATAENLTVEASGTILLVAFLGGVGVFFGPVLGAIVFTLLQSVLSFETDLWQLYIGALFVVTVMYFPQGLAGVLVMHGPVVQSGRLGGLVWPYSSTIAPVIIAVCAAASVLEMVFHRKTRPVGDTELTLFWMPFENTGAAPIVMACVVGLAAVWVAHKRAPSMAAAWHWANRKSD